MTDDAVVVVNEPSVADPTPHRRSEPETAWLARSTTETAQAARTLLNKWIAHYPPAEANDLIARLRSDDHGQFRAAFHELYLHETFRVSDWTPTCHPPLTDTTRRVDFLIEPPEGPCLVEASTTNPGDHGEERRLARLLDSVDTIDAQGFSLSAVTHSVGSADASSSRLLARSDGLAGDIGSGRRSAARRRHDPFV